MSRPDWRTIRPEDIRLVSDFRDAYDHHFASATADREWTWHRMASPPPMGPGERVPSTFGPRSWGRSVDFFLMEQHGLPVVDWGPVAGFAVKDRATRVVVYHDEHAHRGEGKELVEAGPYADSAETGGKWMALASRFVGTPGISYRFLSFGTAMSAWLRYQTRTPGEWRSNVGDVDVAFCEPPRDLYPTPALAARTSLMADLRTPLIAIDFVEAAPGSWLACDLNTAPGVPDIIWADRHMGPEPADVKRAAAVSIARHWARIRTGGIDA